MKRFRAWDGEAVAGRYVMLLSSHGHRLIDPAGIRTVAAFELLLAASDNAINCGFVFSYDVNMILADLPESDAVRLWNIGVVEWAGYTIRYRDRKEFSVRQGKRYVRVWDVFGFFQTSFTRTVQNWLSVDVAEMEKMKLRRPSFGMAELHEIETYCAQECAWLEKIMERLRDAAYQAGIVPIRWDGAGAFAAALLKQYAVRQYLMERGAIAEIARAAFYGGRIECIRFGHHAGPIHTYDLRSAYPAALTASPCYRCGNWTLDHGETDATDALYRVQWSLHAGADCYPFPWRDREGAVFFPARGRGWYWGEELRAARAALSAGVISGNIDVSMTASYRTECDHSPFAWIPALYAQRAAWKREGIPAEKPLKLGLNSLYGKTAQRVGGRRNSPPPYHSMLWASRTTSITRAILFRAAIQAMTRNSLIAFATDAIFSTAELELPIGSAMGEWEHTSHQSGTIVQSGVYWLGDDVEHTRGFFRGEFARADALASWRSGVWAVERTVSRFRGIGAALVMRQGSWRQWVPQTRRLRLEPTGTKRSLLPTVRLAGANRIRPDLGLIVTVPADVSEQIDRTGIDSTMLELPWSRVRGWDGNAWALEDRAENEAESFD